LWTERREVQTVETAKKDGEYSPLVIGPDASAPTGKKKKKDQFLTLVKTRGRFTGRDKRGAV